MNLTNALLKHRKRLLVFDNFFILAHLSWLGIWFFNLGDNSYQFILQYVMPVLTLLAILRLIYGIFLPKILTKRTEKTQILELLDIGKHKVKYLSYRQPYSPLKIEHEALDLSKLDQLVPSDAGNKH